MIAQFKTAVGFFVMILAATSLIGCSQSNSGGGQSSYLTPASTAAATAPHPGNTSSRTGRAALPTARPIIERSAIRFVEIPAGRFVMGSPEDEPGHQPDEMEREVVIETSFFMAVTEITEVQYAALVTLPGGTAARSDMPVTGTTWDEALYFCWTLEAANPSFHFRLPNEAEWEYACRASSSDPFPPCAGAGSIFQDALKKYQTGDTQFLLRKLSHAICFGQNCSALAGSLPSNAWGLYEMAGNVWEWCAVYDTSALSQDYRPIRGGAWSSTDVLTCRAASRAWQRRDSRKDSIGFRVLCVAQ